MNHINHFLFLVLKTDPDLLDAQLKNISLANRHPPHQSRKLDIVFDIDIIDRCSSQGSHPDCFFFNKVVAICLIN